MGIPPYMGVVVMTKKAKKIQILFLKMNIIWGNGFPAFSKPGKSFIVRVSSLIKHIVQIMVSIN